MSAPTAPLPAPLEIPPLAMGLLHDLAPKSPREIILARQAAWAASHLLNLIGDSPAQPDAAWLRLHNTADRVLHRNLRLLDRLASRRAKPSAPPSPAPEPLASPSHTVAPDSSAESHAPPPSPSPSPRPAPPALHRRRDVFRRPRPNLDLSSPFASPAPLPVAATPSPD